MTDKYTNCESVYQFAKELCKEKETGAYAKGYNNALHAIMSAARSEALPAADVRPVVRGRWKKSYADHDAFGVRPFFRYCSECHEATVHQYNFCPNCGADMRKENINEEA